MLLFDRENCTRCGGGGHYSFNLMYGTVCFKCGGSGKQIVSKHRKMRAQWDAAVEIAKNPTLAQIAPGDVLAVPTGDLAQNKRGRYVEVIEYKTFASIVVEPGTEDAWSTKSTNDGVTTIYGFAVLTFTDGTTYRTSENARIGRKWTNELALSLIDDPKTVAYIRSKLSAVASATA